MHIVLETTRGLIGKAKFIVAATPAHTTTAITGTVRAQIITSEAVAAWLKARLPRELAVRQNTEVTGIFIYEAWAVL